MVKKALYLLSILVLTFLFYFVTFSHSSQPDSNKGIIKDLVIGHPPDDAGERIADRGGWQLIEFWHYSGGYWIVSCQVV